MGAHPKDGKSCYQSEPAALVPEGGSVAANEKSAKTRPRIRIKIGKAGEQNYNEAAREVVSSDWSLGRAGHHEDVVADDQDNHTESQNMVDDTAAVAPMSIVDDTAALAIAPMSSESKDGDDNMAEEPPPYVECVECGKTFLSLKALYGHLRCHPLKGYKGAHRQPEAKRKKLLQIGAAAGSSSDRVLAVKRSEKRIIDSDDAVANAARILLQMSRSNDIWSTPSQETDRFQYRKKKRISNEMDEENIEGDAAMHSENVDGFKDERIQKKKKKKKMIKDLESVHEARPPTQDSGYRCNICSKYFPTHQALGGHRASHNKNNNSQEVDREAEDRNLSHAEELVDSNNLVPRAATMEHRCTLCQATFPTGQALGGHKRKHWTGPVTTSSSPPPAPSPVPLAESVQKANNMFMDIDLNKLPKFEGGEP